MSTINKLLYIFNKRQKFEVVGLGILIIIGAAFELLGITAILPFISIAMDSRQALENEYLYNIYILFGFTSVNTFLAFISICLIIIYIVKNAYLIFMNKQIFSFSYENQRRLSDKLLSSYLEQPLKMHIMHMTILSLRRGVFGKWLSVLL